MKGGRCMYELDSNGKMQDDVNWVDVVLCRVQALA